jgi:hypothetical protein
MNVQAGLFTDEVHQVKNERVALDYYPTASGLTQSLIRHYPQLPQLIFEPCAGQGAISQVLEESDRIVVGTDIQECDIAPRDATTREFWEWWDLMLDNAPSDNHDWATVTNPPFNRAAEILPLAYEYSPWGVAFLLRLSYLEPAENRADWLEQHADNMRHLIPVNPRPKFRRDTKGSDSSTVAWMIWQKSWSWRQMGVKCPFIFENRWKQ